MWPFGKLLYVCLLHTSCNVNTGTKTGPSRIDRGENRSRLFRYMRGIYIVCSKQIIKMHDNIREKHYPSQDCAPPYYLSNYHRYKLFCREKSSSLILHIKKSTRRTLCVKTGDLFEILQGVYNKETTSESEDRPFGEGII